MKAILRFLLVIFVVFGIYNCNDTVQLINSPDIENLDKTVVQDNQTKTLFGDSMYIDGPVTCWAEISNLQSQTFIPCNVSTTDITVHIDSHCPIPENCSNVATSYSLILDGVEVSSGSFLGGMDRTIQNVQTGHHSLLLLVTYIRGGVNCSRVLSDTKPFDVYHNSVPSPPEITYGFNNGHPQINWSNPGCFVSQYEIYVSGTYVKNPWDATLLAVVPANQFTYTDNSRIGLGYFSMIHGCPTYHTWAWRYWVRARNDAGLSADGCGCLPGQGDCICQPYMCVTPALESED